MPRPRKNPEEKSVSESLERKKSPPAKYFLSTGSTLLDLAISNRYPGGVGSGRITQFYGGPSTAKTVLLQEILGSAQRAGGTAVYEDAEHTLDFDRAESLFGLAAGAWADEDAQTEFLDKPIKEVAEIYPPFIYRIPGNVESLYDEELAGVIELLQEGKLTSPVAFGVDTLSAMPSIAEQESKLTDGTYGTSRAKQFSAAFRKYNKLMSDLQLTVVALDQVRSKLGISFGDKDAVSGGRAIEFYSSTRVKLSHKGEIKDKNEIPVGVQLDFKVIKNKIAPPFREGPLYILFEYGVDDIRGNLEWLKDKLLPEFESPFKISGAWFAWGDLKLGQGMENAIVGVEELGLVKTVQEEVVRVWKILHAPPKRKTKERV